MGLSFSVKGMLALLKSTGKICTTLGQLVSQSARKKGMVCEADGGGLLGKIGHDEWMDRWVEGAAAADAADLSVSISTLLCGACATVHTRQLSK
jgi:hypothetical protein